MSIKNRKQLLQVAWQGRQVVAVSFLEVKIRCLTIGIFVGKPMTQFKTR